MFFIAEVHGYSMTPALEPNDRVLVRRTQHLSPKLLGRIVVARDPRRTERVMIKRVARIEGDSLVLLGDNPSASTDSVTIGNFSKDLLEGVVVYRYFPLHKAGRIPKRNVREY